MQKEKIYQILDEMLSNPKSKNFLNHLIRAYIPSTNLIKVMETPEKDFKCVLTKDKLLSVNDMLMIINTEEYKDLVFKNIQSVFTGIMDDIMGDFFKDKHLGITGNNTTTYMSITTYQIFNEWVFNKSLNHDKHINWLLNSILPKKENKTKNFSYSNKNSTYNLGDASNVLLNLKTKMENNEKP